MARFFVSGHHRHESRYSQVPIVWDKLNHGEAEPIIKADRSDSQQQDQDKVAPRPHMMLDSCPLRL
jgi:hypothetical protein